MGIQTVNGIINAKSLGYVAPHEHALIDIRNQYSGTQKKGTLGWDGKVTSENRELLMSNPYAMRDNLILDNHDEALSEIKRLAKAGCNTFVDVTPIGLGRDITFLQRIATETFMNVIAATGFYTADAIPRKCALMSENEISELFVKELTLGIDNTTIKAGIIGEIGTSQIIEKSEIKTLKAAAKAHQLTGTPIIVHLYPWGKTGFEVINLLEKENVAPSKICLCHTDVSININYMTELLKQGIYLEFDNFGKEFCSSVPYGEFSSDQERLETLLTLCNKGFYQQLLASCDVCLKVLYHRNCGTGYDHVFTYIMHEISVQRSDAKLLKDLILKKNPANFLDNEIL